MRMASPTRCSGIAAAASSYGDGVAFWALGEMVRMRARITEDEPAASADAKLQAVVASGCRILRIATG